MLTKVRQVLVMLIFWILLMLNYTLKMRNLQLKMNLLSKLRELKFVTALFLELKSDDATKYSNFYSNSEVETIIYKSDIDDQSIKLIWYDCIKHKRNIFEKVRAGLLIESSITLLIFQITTPYLGADTSNYQKNQTIQKWFWLIFK